MLRYDDIIEHDEVCKMIHKWKCPLCSLTFTDKKSNMCSVTIQHLATFHGAEDIKADALWLDGNGRNNEILDFVQDASSRTRGKLFILYPLTTTDTRGSPVLIKICQVESVADPTARREEWLLYHSLHLEAFKLFEYCQINVECRTSTLSRTLDNGLGRVVRKELHEDVLKYRNGGTTISSLNSEKTFVTSIRTQTVLDTLKKRFNADPNLNIELLVQAKADSV